MAGCVLQENYGSTEPLSIPLSLLHLTQTVPDAQGCTLAALCGSGSQACGN